MSHTVINLKRTLMQQTLELKKWDNIYLKAEQGNQWTLFTVCNIDPLNPNIVQLVRSTQWGMEGGYVAYQGTWYYDDNLANTIAWCSNVYFYNKLNETTRNAIIAADYKVYQYFDRSHNYHDFDNQNLLVCYIEPPNFPSAYGYYAFQVKKTINCKIAPYCVLDDTSEILHFAHNSVPFGRTIQNDDNESKWQPVKWSSSSDEYREHCIYPCFWIDMTKILYIKAK